MAALAHAGPYREIDHTLGEQPMPSSIAGSDFLPLPLHSAGCVRNDHDE